MARKVVSVHRFERDPKFRLAKEFVVIRCDDGAVYEFEKPEGARSHRFIKTLHPDGSRTNTGSRKRLPESVESTVGNLVERWER